MRLGYISMLALLAGVAGAQAADLPTKKAPPAPPAPANCFSSLYAYFDSSPTDCPLSYAGITLYATIDVGVGYESHGVPFNRTMQTGVEELLNKNSNKSLFLATPNGLSQSQVGLKAKEPLAWGWSFVGEVATGFDPYSLELGNGPGAQVENNLIKLPYQSANADSSRAGQWDNSVGYLGFSHDQFGTITAGRQNALTLDGVNAYDPMGGSYAFSLIGWSGKTAGAGGTEDARENTSVKYALKYNNFRLNAMWQFGGYDWGNGENGEWEVGVGGDFGGFSADGIYTHIRDQVNLSTYNGPVPAGVPTNALKATLSDNDSVMLLGKYKWDKLTLYGGYEYIRYTNPSDTYPNGFTAINYSPVVSNAVYSGSITTTAYTNPLNFDVLWTGAKYAITDRLDITGAYYLYIQNDYNTTHTPATCAPNTTVAAAGFAPLGTASSKCLGYENVFSAMVDWRPLKRLDVYGGVMYSKVTGGLATGYLESDNWAPTVGLRLRF